MALAQEFWDVFIRIEDVSRVYPGGFPAYLEDFAADIGNTIWHNKFLLREGAMSGADGEEILAGWTRLGLRPAIRKPVKCVEWLELCVSGQRMGGPTLPCSWIDFDPRLHGALLKGTKPGPLVWPHRRGHDNNDELMPELPV